MNVADLQPRAQRIAKLLKAMSNGRRLLILHHLCEKERSVNELVDLVGLSQSAMSQHLARLRRDGLIIPRRSRQTIHYSLKGSIPAALLAALHTIFIPGPESRTQVPDDREPDGALFEAPDSG